MFDTLFCNARIVDGTGTPWFWGSLGVQDGFVAAVLPRTTKPLSRHTIVLEGGILCPGFVDGHSHSERPLLSGEPTDCKTMQGVATENLGLDGMSPPLCDLSPIFWGGTRANWVLLSQEEAIRKMTSLTGPQDPAGAQGRHPARI